MLFREIISVYSESRKSRNALFYAKCDFMKLRNVLNGCKTGCICRPSVIQEVEMDATDRHTLGHMSDPQGEEDVTHYDNLWPLCLCKGTVHPVTCHEDPEGEWRYSCTLSLTSTLEGVGG
jgi:hypothetical protein